MKTLSVKDAHRDFHAIVKAVAEGGESVLVTVQGIPRVVIDIANPQGLRDPEDYLRRKLRRP